jgi:hypothetical protein
VTRCMWILQIDTLAAESLAMAACKRRFASSSHPSYWCRCLCVRCCSTTKHCCLLAANAFQITRATPRRFALYRATLIKHPCMSVAYQPPTHTPPPFALLCSAHSLPPCFVAESSIDHVLQTRVVAMDAENYGSTRESKLWQYAMTRIERELNKAHCAFDLSHLAATPRSFATGYV